MYQLHNNRVFYIDLHMYTLYDAQKGYTANVCVKDPLKFWYNYRGLSLGRSHRAICMICFTFQLKLAGGVDAGAKELPRAAARRKTRNDETLRRKTVKQSWKNIKPSDLSDKL